MLTSPSSRARAFTLVEILVVVAILSLLAAFLFPAFARARESARQSSCLSNLHQIGLAVTLYSQDFNHRYPASLAELVPPSIVLASSAGSEGWNKADEGALGTDSPTPDDSNSNTAMDDAGVNGGYLRSEGVLHCPDDGLEALWNRSSYGVLLAEGRLYSGDAQSRKTVDVDPNFEPLVWNYYGYRADGTAFRSPAEAAAGAQTEGAKELLRNPNGAYDARFNPFKRSLSNRFLPADTIISHCRFHRPATSNLSDPNAVYTKPERGQGARDAVLRLDGSARVIDISGFASSNEWRK